MKKKKRSNIYITSLIIVFVLVIGVLVGYFVISKNFSQKVNVTKPNQQAHDQGNNLNNTKKDNLVTSKNDQPSTSQNGNNDIVTTYTAYGRFVGGIDAHSVEINLINSDYDYSSFEVSDDVKAYLQKEPISEGKLIKIDFTKDNSNNNPRIIKLEKVESVKLKGKFVGLSDNNFAEFLFDNHHVVLQITDVVEKVSNLDANTLVWVEIEDNPSNLQANPVVKYIGTLK